MKKINYIFGYIYIVLSLFLLSFDLLSDGIVKKTFNNRLDVPTFYSFDISSLGSFDSFFSTYTQVKSENELLKKEITALQNKNNSNIELEKEIKELKSILRYQTTTEQVLLTTKILGFETFPLKSAIVDIGENKGVSEGDIVLDPEGRVVGKVKFVLPMYSEVTLVTSSDFRINSIDAQGNKFIVFNQDEEKLFARSLDSVREDLITGILTTSRVFNHGGEYPIAKVFNSLQNEDGVTSGEAEIISNVYGYKYFQIVIRDEVSK